ncbi:glutathione S-transferase family protein [Chondromyces apiculatus]|uniref:Glutathione S-transferase n=1 Tax=Chondromyces apiculatus DSM 436 TaxID=1192034 RepID=A0A017TAN3_9BACT|nr:glutathione S-transferase family protein [Chondromyces apiculatus]EYF05661.1 Hypothetical protein CAP_2951 [Chondromyces apiculatus DSM 436]
MKLYCHFLSGYSQKVLMAFYEKGVPFTPELVTMMDPAGRALLDKVSPFGKIPCLVLDDGRTLIESTVMIEHLDVHYPDSGTRLFPEGREDALEARLLDRVFDHYVNEQVVTVLFDSLKPAAARDPQGVARAKATLDKAYAWLEARLAGRTWAVGESFSVADCAAAPSLLYGQQIHPFEQRGLKAYTARLAERPSMQRVLADAAPFMSILQPKEA